MLQRDRVVTVSAVAGRGFRHRSFRLSFGRQAVFAVT
jgi:hypothetical protein